VVDVFVDQPDLAKLGFERVKTEMSLHVLAYNLKRLIAVLGVAHMMEAIKAFIHLWGLKAALLAFAVAFQRAVHKAISRSTTRCSPLNIAW
jgi:hypothetical protein